MSTVLKAVQELDRRAVPLTSPELPAGDRPRIATWAIALVALGLVTAVGVVGRRTLDNARAPHETLTVPVPIVVAAAPVVVAPPSAVAPLPAVAAPAAAGVVPSDLAMRSATDGAVSDVTSRSRADAAAPWGRVESPPAEPSVSVEARTHPRRRPPAERDDVRSAAVSPPPAVREAPLRDAPTGLGLPRVQVRAIVSGSDTTGRRAVLSIGGGPSVTLHEGESSDGVDVQFITERTVYLRHRGNIFTVGMDH